jgi:hypothetical protein
MNALFQIKEKEERFCLFYFHILQSSFHRHLSSKRIRKKRRNAFVLNSRMKRKKKRQ